VDGSGTPRRIEYVNGPDNQKTTATPARSPWNTTLSLPVGPAGGVAFPSAANPDSGQSLTCRILIGRTKIRQTTSVNRYRKVSCSTVVPPLERT
jgi:hypothetical protein